MKIEEFKQSVAGAEPPEGATKPIEALWWAKKGDWEKAHAAAQSDPTKNGAWVHGHLHRVEGDLDNAGYWYGQAGRAPSRVPLEEEWETIAATLLAAVPASA